MKETKIKTKQTAPSFLATKSSAKPNISGLASLFSKSKTVSKENIKSFGPAIQEITKLFANYMQDYTNISFFSELAAINEIEFFKLKTIIKPNDYVVFFNSTALGGYVILLLEADLIDLFVSAFYGALSPGKNKKIYSNLSAGEQRTAYLASEKFAEAINEKLSRNGAPFIELEKALTGSEISEKRLENDNLYDFTIAVRFPGASGKMRLFITDRSYRPFYQHMLELLKAKPNISDQLWNDSLAKEVNNTELTLQAYINQGTMSLYELSQLQPGQILPLPSGAFSNINIQSSNKHLYRGSLGKMGTHFSVKINEFITNGAER